MTLLAAVLFSSLFFVLNSGPFPGRLTEALRAVLPGTLEFGTIQVSPIPWHVDVLDVRISTPSGEEVVSAGTVSVAIDIIPLLALLTGKTRDVVLHFNSIRLSDFSVAIVFDQTGHLKFLDAFVWPSEPEPTPSGEEGPAVVLDFPYISGENGTALVSFPEWDIRVENIVVEASVALDRAQRIRVTSPSLSFSGGVAHVRAAPDVAEVPREIRLGSGRVKEFVFDTDRIAIQKARISTPDALIETSGRLAFPQDGPLDYEGSVDLILPDASRLVEIATNGLIKGPIAIHAEGVGDESDPRFFLKFSSPSLLFRDVPLGEVQVNVSGAREGSGQYAFSNIAIQAHPGGGRLSLESGSVRPFGGAFEAIANLNIENVKTSDFLVATGLPSPSFPVPTAFSGRVDVAIRISADTIITHEVDLKGPLTQDSPFGNGEITFKAIGVTTFPGCSKAPFIRLTELSMQSGRNALRAHGTVDLMRSALDMTAYAGLNGLTFGNFTVETIFLRDIRLLGSLNQPEIRGVFEIKGLNYGDWRVEETSGAISVSKWDLKVDGFSAKTAFTTITADQVILRDLLGQHRRLEARTLRLEGINISEIPTFRTMRWRGRGEIVSDMFQIDLNSPLKTLSFKAKGQFANLFVLGRSWNDLSLELNAKNGQIEVNEAVAHLRGGGTFEAKGHVNTVEKTLDFSLTASQVPLWAVADTSSLGPLQGSLDARVLLAGKPADPMIKARIDLSSVAYRDVRIGTLALEAQREPGTDLFVTSERFLPGVRLRPESRVIWKDGSFTGFVAGVALEDAKLQSFIPSIRPRDMTAKVTGDLSVEVGFGATHHFEASLTIPKGGIELGFFHNEVRLVADDTFVLSVHQDGSITVSGLVLTDGTERISACGEVFGADGRIRMLVRGGVGMYWLRAIRSIFSSARGYVFLSSGGDGKLRVVPRGCENHGHDDSLFINGTPERPEITGTITTGDVELMLRRYPETLRIEAGSRVIFSARQDGHTAIEIPAQGLRGTLGDGHFSLRGQMTFSGISPESGDIKFTGSGIRIVSPGQFYCVIDPDLEVSFSGGDREIALSGKVAVTDGSYHRNFDTLRRAFSSVVGERVAEREGQFALPDWLSNAELDVAITGPRFGLRSKLPVGSTDLDLAFDLRLKGTIGNPELWNRVEVHSGGKVIYDIVRREFEVQKGVLDFRGDPTRPLVDLTARTNIEYRGTSTTASVASSRYSSLDFFSDDTVQVTLRASGVYPELDISLSSNAKDLDQTDLQYLLLTGMTPGSFGQAGTGKGLDLGLLTDDVTNLVTKLLLSPFVDTVRFGVTSKGEVNAEVAAHVGSRIKFETRVLQDQAGARYMAGFQVRLSNRLSLDGRVRAVEQGLTDPTEPARVFESKLRYRIPLD